MNGNKSNKMYVHFRLSDFGHKNNRALLSIVHADITFAPGNQSVVPPRQCAARFRRADAPAHLPTSSRSLPDKPLYFMQQNHINTFF